MFRRRESRAGRAFGATLYGEFRPLAQGTRGRWFEMAFGVSEERRLAGHDGRMVAVPRSRFQRSGLARLPWCSGGPSVGVSCRTRDRGGVAMGVMVVPAAAPEVGRG